MTSPVSSLVSPPIINLQEIKLAEPIDPRAIEIVKHAEEIAARFQDGFDATDIPSVTIRAMEIVDKLQGLKGSEKKDFALDLIAAVIEKLDPELKPHLATVGATIDIIIQASKGEVDVNKAAEVATRGCLSLLSCLTKKV
ncbi:MAG: hypothetical protein ACI9S8_001595 [Chlamydiales bacterium]|jgi:hypothetical protein